MKAVLSKAPGLPDTLVLEDVPSPTPKAGEIVVSVKAVGVNFPDFLIIQDMYQFKPRAAVLPGRRDFRRREGGRRRRHGSSRSATRCSARRARAAWRKRSSSPANRMNALPDFMPFDEAAAFLMTYGTSHYALKDRGHIKPGETLLVLGAAGGVGLAAVELGVAMGATVIAAASSQEKVDFCISKGAHKGLVYPENPLSKEQQKAFSDQIKELGGGGVDVIYDGVGGDYAEPAVRALNWEGRFLGDRLPGGHPETAAQPYAFEILPDRRRVLGRFRCT